MMIQLKVLILMISNLRKKNKPVTKSKTPVLNNFGRDLTLLAEEDKLDPVIGRRNEVSIHRLFDVCNCFSCIARCKRWI